jgi:hypothetical protein
MRDIMVAKAMYGIRTPGTAATPYASPSTQAPITERLPDPSRMSALKTQI